jgi:hypothetical protein
VADPENNFSEDCTPGHMTHMTRRNDDLFRGCGGIASGQQQGFDRGGSIAGPPRRSRGDNGSARPRDRGRADANLVVSAFSAGP